MALLGGQTVPAHRFGVVLGHSPPLEVHIPQTVLRYIVALLPGETVPANRFRVVLGHTPALGVHSPQIELR